MPAPVAEYYEVSDMIDRHNCIRQDSLDLEKSIEVKDWSFRLNSTLLGIICTDAFLLYKFGKSGRSLMSAHKFWCVLATALIENEWDGIGVRGSATRAGSSSGSPSSSLGKTPRTSTDVHLTPTKRMRRTQTGSLTTAYAKQMSHVPQEGYLDMCWLSGS